LEQAADHGFEDVVQLLLDVSSVESLAGAAHVLTQRFYFNNQYNMKSKFKQPKKVALHR